MERAHRATSVKHGRFGGRDPLIFTFLRKLPRHTVDRWRKHYLDNRGPTQRALLVPCDVLAQACAAASSAFVGYILPLRPISDRLPTAPIGALDELAVGTSGIIHGVQMVTR